jgi:hypothetical protein
MIADFVSGCLVVVSSPWPVKKVKINDRYLFFFLTSVVPAYRVVLRIPESGVLFPPWIQIQDEFFPDPGSRTCFAEIILHFFIILYSIVLISTGIKKTTKTCT